MLAALLAVIVVAFGTTGNGHSTPVPGGANQVNALTAPVGQTVFNGDLRMKIVALRDATSADNPDQMHPSPNQKVMVLNVLLANGLHSAFTDLVTYTLADKDAVTIQIPSSDVTPSNLNIQQGASARQTALFLVDKTFVPTKLIVQCSSCSASEGFKPVRFTIPAQ